MHSIRMAGICLPSAVKSTVLTAAAPKKVTSDLPADLLTLEATLTTLSGNVLKLSEE